MATTLQERLQQALGDTYLLEHAQLQHSHGFPVLDAGTRDSLRHCVMPYVTRESLRTRSRPGTCQAMPSPQRR